MAENIGDVAAAVGVEDRGADERRPVLVQRQALVVGPAGVGPLDGGAGREDHLQRARGRVPRGSRERRGPGQEVGGGRRGQGGRGVLQGGERGAGRAHGGGEGEPEGLRRLAVGGDLGVQGLQVEAAGGDRLPAAHQAGVDGFDLGLRVLKRVGQQVLRRDPGRGHEGFRITLEPARVDRARQGRDRHEPPPGGPEQLEHDHRMLDRLAPAAEVEEPVSDRRQVDVREVAVEEHGGDAEPGRDLLAGELQEGDGFRPDGGRIREFDVLPGVQHLQRARLEPAVEDGTLLLTLEPAAGRVRVGDEAGEHRGDLLPHQLRVVRLRGRRAGAAPGRTTTRRALGPA